MIEIRGTRTVNKGAELMLRAIVQQLDGEQELAVEPKIGPYSERSRMGLYQKFYQNRVPDSVCNFPGKVLPQFARKRLKRDLGIIFERDVDVILDAWGFAYSDQFDVERCEKSAERAQRWKRAGKKVVIMPQAFGPFTSHRLRTAFAKLLDNTDLVFAREQTSYDHVMSCGGRKDHVRLAPDFTSLLHPPVPTDFHAPDNLAIIVPSAKLLTETKPEISRNYLPFMRRNVELLRARGMNVHLMVHEAGDAKVVEQLNAMLDETAPVIRLRDALSLKGIIGASKIIVSSRFHAIVSALTQGVPALAIGWSHKYEMLLSDYGCSEFVVDPTLGDDVLTKLYERALGEGEKEQLLSVMSAALTEQQNRTEDMWNQIRALLRTNE